MDRFWSNREIKDVRLRVFIGDNRIKSGQDGESAAEVFALQLSIIQMVVARTEGVVMFR